jgi:fructuronate reductase
MRAQPGRLSNRTLPRIHGAETPAYGCGAMMVRDVAPFEEMKLRPLNGAHFSIAHLGLLRGHETVAAAFDDPRIHSFVQGLWNEAVATLKREAALDAAAYTGELAHRFDNPALMHRTAQIATDGSQKLPQRIIAPVLARARGVAATLAALSSGENPS